MKKHYIKLMMIIIARFTKDLFVIFAQTELYLWLNAIQDLFLLYKKVFVEYEFKQDLVRKKVLFEDSRSPELRIGLIKPRDPSNDTVLLTDIQKHVILYEHVNNKEYIVWAYLTSNKDENNPSLSKDKAFQLPTDKPDPKSEQCLRILATPIIVLVSDIENLPKDNQARGEAYIHRTDIEPQLKHLFDTVARSRLQNESFIYNGKGITEVEFDEIIFKAKTKAEATAKEWFNKYKTKSTDKQRDTYISKMEGKESSQAYAVAHLKKLIENDKNKNTPK